MEYFCTQKIKDPNMHAGRETIVLIGDISDLLKFSTGT